MESKKTQDKPEAVRRVLIFHESGVVTDGSSVVAVGGLELLIFELNKKVH